MSDAIGVAGLVVSVIGIPLAYFLAKRGRQRPDLRYMTDFVVLLKPHDQLIKQGLSMSFSGHPITRISRTRVALWNQSGDPVRGTDVVPSDPLRLSVKEGERILRVTTLFTSRPQILAEIKMPEKDEPTALVSFDFLDAGDGAVFEVVHEGENPPELSGTIRGAVADFRGKASLDPDLISKLTVGGKWAKFKGFFVGERASWHNFRCFS